MAVPESKGRQAVQLLPNDRILTDSTTDTGPKEDQQAARAGEYGGKIEVLVLRCFDSHISEKALLSPLSGRSGRSGRSSAGHSYMDDQEIPMMTGAMLDGASDFPVPGRRGRPDHSARTGRKSSAKYGYMDDQEVPMMTGALLDNTSDLLLPESQRRAHHSARPRDDQVIPIMTGALVDGESELLLPKGWRRPHKSRRTGEKLRISSIHFMDGGNSSPDSSRGRSKEMKRKLREAILSSYRHGTGAIETREPGKIKHQNQSITASEPMHPRLRGGGNSDTSWSNHSDQQDHRSRKRRGSTALDSPKISGDNWADGQSHNGKSRTWEPQGDTGWNSHGESSGAGINDTAWNGSGIIQREDQWNTTNGTNDHSQKHTDWNGSHNDVGDDGNGWNDAADSNIQQDNWGNAVDHDDAFQSQSAKDIVFGSSHNSASSKSLNSGRSIDSKFSPAISSKPALQSPLNTSPPRDFQSMESTEKSTVQRRTIPGSWSPPVEPSEQKNRSESIEQQVAALNAERAKVAKARLDAKMQKDKKPHTKPKSALSAGFSHPISREPISPIISPTFKVHPAGQKSPSSTRGEQPIMTEPDQNEVPGRDSRSPSPVEYTHKTGIPNYMDTIADPYARFIFRYREDTVISDMIDKDIVEPKEVLQDRLHSLTKQQIIEMLIEEREEAVKEQEETESVKDKQKSTGDWPDLDAASQKLNQWSQKNNNGGANDWDNGNNNNNGATDHGKTSNGSNDWGDNNSRNDGSQGSNKSHPADHQNDAQWGDTSNDPPADTEMGGDNNPSPNNGDDANNGAEADW